jgi:quercetin dioxygenase-like cupin family protein
MESQTGDAPEAGIAGRPAERLSAPIIDIELEGELELLRSSNSYRTADHAATTILKRPGIRVLLVALRAGGQMHEHHANSPITVQVLEGHIRFEVGGRILELKRGHLIGVAEVLPHRVLAVEKSAFLLTIGAVLTPP